MELTIKNIFEFSLTGPSGPGLGWGQNDVPSPRVFILGLSLALRSHNQFPGPTVFFLQEKDEKNYPFPFYIYPHFCPPSPPWSLAHD